MKITHIGDVNRKLTPQEKEALEAIKDKPIEFDEDCPELTKEQLLQLKRVSDEQRSERIRQSVTLKLSPQAVETAKSLSECYPLLLSRILESVLADSEAVKHYL